MRAILTLAACLCLMVCDLDGCSNRTPAAPSGKLEVAAGIPPIAYLAARVGGDFVNVETLLAPGQSPHTYEPTPAQITGIAKSKVFLQIDWPFETQIIAKLKDLSASMKVVDLTQGITFRKFSTAEQEADEKADLAEAGGKAQPPEPPPAGNADASGEPDPHVWMSPKNAIIMTANIAKAFAEADPAHAADYQKNAGALTADLQKLDQELAQALAPIKGKRFMVYHPAFGYFADAYGLIQSPVEVEGKEPGPQQLVKFTQRAKEEGVKVIFVQPQFSARSAEAVAEAIGGAVVPLDVLAYDYISNLRDVARKVTAALETEGGKAQ